MKKIYSTCVNILKEAFDANTTAHKFSERSQNAYWCGDYERANEYSEDKSDFYHKKSKKILIASFWLDFIKVVSIFHFSSNLFEILSREFNEISS